MPSHSAKGRRWTNYHYTIGKYFTYIVTQLGHSSPMATLNVYAHLMEPRNQDAAYRLEDTIFGDGYVLGVKSSKGSTHPELTP